MVHALDGKAVAAAVQVAVAAFLHAVALEERQNFRAFVAAVARRIVQKAVFFRVSRQLQSAFEPPEFPPEDLLVVAAGLVGIAAKRKDGDA